jgi:predicted DsbA family dithiol-disulfide isomerase
MTAPTLPVEHAVTVEVWSDIACPWCLIGKRRLDRALSAFAGAGDVQVVWRSFQLDPTIPREVCEPEFEHLSKKFGRPEAAIRAMTDQVKAIAADEGLSYDFDRALVTNTFDAHRLAHLGAEHGLGAEIQARLMEARLVEGEALNDPEVLVRLAVEVGVPESEARSVVQSDRYAADVERDRADAASLGVSGVPFFVFNRTFGVSGAQSVETLAAALEQAHTGS